MRRQSLTFWIAITWATLTVMLGGSATVMGQPALPLPADNACAASEGARDHLFHDFTVVPLLGGIPIPIPKAVNTRCGEYAPAGCSCKADCAYIGNCCLDAVAACANAPDGQWLIDGDAFNTYSPMAEVAQRLMYGVATGSWRDRKQETQWIAPQAYHSHVMYGLTKAVFGGVDGRDEIANCSIGGDRLEFQAAVEASVWSSSAGDINVECAAQAIRAKGISLVSYTRAAANDTLGATHVQWLTDTSAGAVPVLTEVRFTDTDGQENAFCEVYQWEGAWYLKANQEGDASAYCAAALYHLGDNVRYAGSSYVDVDGETTTEYGTGKNAVPLAREGDHACFLQKIGVRDLDEGDETAGCTIKSKRGDWWLEATAAKDSYASCAAACFQITGKAFPASNAVVTSDTDPTTRYYLYQSGAYDRPLVFVEGFDPTNKLSPVPYIKSLAIPFRALQLQGFDIWVVDFGEGGGDLFQNARAVAEGIKKAQTYAGWDRNHPGQKFPVIGVSMGGILTRLALASWEQGLYASGAAEAVSGTHDARPPVSTWVSVAGTHRGANIPVSAQTAIQNLRAGISALAGLEAYQALNSPAARQMLTWFVQGPNDGACTEKLLWEWCGAEVAGLKIKGANMIAREFLKVVGNEVYSYPYRAVDPPWYFKGSCPVTQEFFNAAYNAIKARGMIGNGYPQTVNLKVALTNGSWYQQSCLRLEDGVECDDSIRADLGPSQTFIAEKTPIGFIDFFSGGKNVFGLGFYACSGDGEMKLFAHGDDIAPGDLSGRSLQSLEIVGLRRGVRLGFSQFVPFMHHRTDYDLDCALEHPGADADPTYSNDAWCTSVNRRDQRFERVHSNPDKNSKGFIYNGSHGSLSDHLTQWLLAYVYDGRPGGDADGYFTPCADPANPDHLCNPFYNEALHAAVLDNCPALHSKDNTCMGANQIISTVPLPYLLVIPSDAPR